MLYIMYQEEEEERVYKKKRYKNRCCRRHLDILTEDLAGTLVSQITRMPRCLKEETALCLEGRVLKGGPIDDDT